MEYVPEGSRQVVFEHEQILIERHARLLLEKVANNQADQF